MCVNSENKITRKFDPSTRPEGEKFTVSCSVCGVVQSMSPGVVTKNTEDIIWVICVETQGGRPMVGFYCDNCENMFYIMEG